MTACLGKSCSFGLLCVFFVNVYEFVCALLSPFGFEDGMWDLSVLIPDHCLSIFFAMLDLNKLAEYSTGTSQKRNTQNEEQSANFRDYENTGTE